LTALLLTVLVLAGAAALSPPAGAEAEEPVYGVDETVRLRVDAVGNVDHEYVLVYDQAFFAEHGASFEEYPFLLVRRYRAREAVDEIEGLKADLDREAGRVTLSFREPGRVYNLGDRWVLYGLSGPPDEVVDGVALLREENTENNDFTLWQDLAFTTVTKVSLPEGAEHIRWDDAESALVWQTPEQVAAYGGEGTVLQRHRELFALLFSAFMAGALVVLILALTRRERGQSV
jgi:hypothetical protein